jgi:DNA-binding MarR family transcriptional regulator
MFDSPRYRTWIQVVKTYQRCHHVFSDLLGDLGLTVAQHELLVAVSRDPGLTQNTLASRLLVTKSNVTGLIARMETKGWLKRKNDPDDGRARRVTLTAAGSRLVKKSLMIQEEMVTRMVQHLNDEETEELHRIMSEMDQILKDYSAEKES